MNHEMDLSMEPDLGIATAQEYERAFRVILRHCPETVLPLRVASALRMLQGGELDAEGLIVLRDQGDILGAAIATVVPGKTGIVWPPQSRESDPACEDLLTHHQLEWMRKRGARLAQALLAPSEVSLAAPLLRAGYRHLTSLWYLHHDHELSLPLFKAPPRLGWQTYAEADRRLFHQVLAQTFEETLDCPEVTHLRSVEEVVIGFQSQGTFDPGNWWLAWDDALPVGVLILSPFQTQPVWEVCYVGVVPGARRRGHGSEMVLKALLEARAADVSEVFLTVDGRNLPAWDLYRRLGFEAFDRREVFFRPLND